MPHQRNTGAGRCPQYNQAQKIIRRFGGEAHLASVLGLNRVTVYRWQYRRPWGSDGLIPTIHVENIRKAARVEGIVLGPNDWAPEKISWPEEIINAEPKAFTKVQDLLS